MNLTLTSQDQPFEQFDLRTALQFSERSTSEGRAEPTAASPDGDHEGAGSGTLLPAGADDV